MILPERPLNATTYRPMEHNKELELAWEYAEHTGVSIFLTGKAGTGKTTFLRTLRQHSAKTMVVVAPTGVAAINAGGVTIHSFFQLPLSPYVPGSDYRDKFNFSKEKLRIIRALDLLVIDEISMVRSDLLDAIDNALRKYRRKPQPFGGVQLLMIGDLQQLAPVVTPQDEAMLRDYYPTPYFFGSNALAQTPYVTIELTKVYRQQNSEFINLLNNVRANRLEQADRALLTSRLNPSFHPAPDSGFIRLTTHNHLADSYNFEELERIRRPRFNYVAQVKGTFPDYSFPTAQRLELKVGAQVMFVKNDPTPEKRFYNGKIGHVVYADPGCVRVMCAGENEPIDVTPQVWENARYTVNDLTNKIETEVQGTFTQIPLRLAWAITIHKSQGLTFDKVIIDAGASFAPGQIYVALSRCKTLEGIVLATDIGGTLIGSDPQVDAYITRQDAEAAMSNQRLPMIKREYFRQLLLDLFQFGELVMLQESLTRQLTQTFRNAFPTETANQQKIGIDLREKVVEVADIWISRLSNMSYEQLKSKEVMTRVGNSAVYFHKELERIFSDTLRDAAKVRTDNKKASQRIKETVADLRQKLDMHLQLLSRIAQDGFSMPTYLRLKQEASLDASRENTLKRVAKGGKLARDNRTKKKTGAGNVQPKEKKVPSHEVSFDMMRKGMTREEIAQARGMVMSTITGHLIRHVENGDITLHDIFTPLTVNAIRSAMEICGPDAGFMDLRVKLPAEISDLDLRTVAHALRQSQKTPEQ